MKSAIASLASKALRQRTWRFPPGCRAPPIAGASRGSQLGHLGRLVVAIWLNAVLLLLPVHGAGPPELSVEQAMTAPAKGTEETSPEAFPTEEFLDRLMAAESGGRLNKKNPRSTALGPFQFIESTFLFVVNKQFPSEVAGLTEKQVLALRTNLAFSRRAARAYTNDLISALKAQGLPATTVNVRIAFLVGPAAAVRLLKAPTDEPLKKVLSADAIAANPFMSDATVGRLVQKAAAEVSATAATRQFGPLKTELAAAPAGLEPEPADTAVPFEGEPGVTLVALEREPADTPVVSKGEPADAPVAPTGELRATTRVEPAFEIKCEIGLASCRKWIAQQEKARLLGQSAQQ